MNQPMVKSQIEPDTLWILMSSVMRSPKTVGRDCACQEEDQPQENVA